MASMAVCLAALGYDPVKDLVSDRVDLVEINHFYDEKGRLVFDQIIFYDWCAQSSRYNVRDWRLLKKPAQIPHRSGSGSGYFSIWQDGETLRRVHTSAVRETWTQHDPELVEREFLPKDKRRKLQAHVVKAQLRDDPRSPASSSGDRPPPDRRSARPGGN